MGNNQGCCYQDKVADMQPMEDFSIQNSFHRSKSNKSKSSQEVNIQAINGFNNFMILQNEPIDPTILQVKNKYIYKGQLKNNLAHGRGSFNCLRTKRVFEGQFQFGDFTGYGLQFHYRNNVQNKKLVYRGYFKNWNRHGKGIQFDPLTQQKIYTGYFQFGYYHGKGVFMNKNQRIVGYFQNGKPSGKIEQQNEKQIYYGDMQKGVKIGIGEQLNKANGKLYIGEFKGDEKQGLGILYDKQKKQQYKGQFSKNVFHGYGISGNNTKKKGFYYSGQMVQL